MDNKKRLEWVFKAVEYLHQYRNNGIKFILVDNAKLETIKSGDMLFEAPARNTQLQDYTTARFCKERWTELEPTKTFEDFIEYELKFIDSIPAEVYNDFEFQLDILKKYYKDWLKKEQNYFPENDPFANWRKTKQQIEGFYRNYNLHQDNPKKINGYAKKLYEKEFFNVAHRAEVEIEKNIIFLTTKGKDFCNSIQEDLNQYKDQHNEMLSNELFKGANMPKMIATLNNLQPLWKLIDQFNKIFKSTSSEDKKEEQKGKITNPIKTRFCELLQISQLVPRYEHSKVSYCREICRRFDLEHSDLIRQRFNWDATIAKHDPTMKDVVKLILPTLKKEHQVKLESYIRNESTIYG